MDGSFALKLSFFCLRYELVPLFLIQQFAIIPNVNDPGISCDLSFSDIKMKKWKNKIDNTDIPDIYIRHFAVIYPVQILSFSGFRMYHVYLPTISSG